MRSTPLTSPRSALSASAALPMSSSAGADGGEKGRAGLGQRHAARRAREQRFAEAILDDAHGVAHRRRAHREFGRRGGEAAMARHRGDGRQMGEKVAIH